jgi:TetR/AcrR family transcriptional repressor of nem operon
MRYPPAETARKHDDILQAASALFRADGLGVNVRDIMRAAGLTHGAFYSHFDSKDALIAESAARSVSETLDLIRMAEAAPIPRKAFVDAYLSPEHRDDRAGGCTIAAIGSELARQSEDVRAALSGQIDEIIDRIAGLPGAEPGSTLSRQEAVRMFALGIGALIVARLVTGGLSDEILDAARRAFGD